MTHFRDQGIAVQRTGHVVKKKSGCTLTKMSPLVVMLVCTVGLVAAGILGTKHLRMGLSSAACVVVVMLMLGMSPLAQFR